MVEIKGSNDCGNSPKNKLVEDIAIALEIGNVAPDLLGEGVVLDDGVHTSGRDAVCARLSTTAEPQSVRIEHVTSHGKIGAASGKTVLADGHTRRFCHMLEFTSVKAVQIAVISTYR